MEFLRILPKKKIAIKQIAPQLSNSGKKLEEMRRLSSDSWFIILIGILLIGGLWSFAWQQINYESCRTITEASNETMNLSIAFEEYVQTVVSDADTDLRNLKKAYERDGFLSPAVLDDLENMSDDSIRNQVAIYNEQGFLVGSFIKGLPVTNYSDRSYFQVHRDSANDTLFIGPTIQLRALGQNIIPLSRRINKPDGSFGGIVYIGLKAEHLLRFYQKMKLGQDELITLTGMDGFLRARQSNDKMNFGEDIRQGALWKDIVQTGWSYGTLTTTAGIDGINRISSYRVLSKYPLIVTVGKSTEVIMSSFEQRKKIYLLWFSLISLLSLIFCGLLVNRNQKQMIFNTQLLHMNNKVTAIFESISDPFYTLDKEWRLTYINEEAAQVGIQLNETHLGQNIWEVYPELVGGERYQNYLEAFATTTPIHKIFKGLSGKKQFDTHIYPYADGLFVYCRDITEQKEYEVDLLRLDRLNLIGEMAASIGHEVRNPMTTVRGYLQWFSQKNIFVEHHESFALMIGELDRANSIITEFLSLAKDKKVNMILTDLNKIILSLFPLLQADAFLRGNDIKLDLQEPFEIFMDEKEMRQCILNLVGNGLDSMPSGGNLTISTASLGSQMVLTVRDRGMGMTSDVKANLGTPFFTTKENGTGLGLSVCYRIAQRHEANIEVETGSEGTAFHFIFNKKNLPDF